MEVEVGPRVGCLFSSQLHPHLVPGMETVPVSEITGCVPAGVETVSQAPSWAGPCLPMACDLQPWLGPPHCAPEVDQRAKRSPGAALMQAGQAAGQQGPAKPWQARRYHNRQPVSMASHAAHSSRLIDTHSGPACGSCRIKADVCSWFELDPINRPLFVSK